jgi:hypothetical protein
MLPQATVLSLAVPEKVLYLCHNQNFQIAKEKFLL